jgi:hypothetical protein
MSVWLNWIERSTSNREAPGSSPGIDFKFNLSFSLQNDVILRHKFFLNLYFRLRKTVIKNLETNIKVIYKLKMQ